MLNDTSYVYAYFVAFPQKLGRLRAILPNYDDAVVRRPLRRRRHTVMPAGDVPDQSGSHPLFGRGTMSVLQPGKASAACPLLVRPCRAGDLAGPTWTNGPDVRGPD